jgi:tetratricopeptide (TPR) repeat protein
MTAVVLASLAALVCMVLVAASASAGPTEVTLGELPVASVSASDRSPAGAIDLATSRLADGDVHGAIAGLAGYVAAHPYESASAIFLGDLYVRSGDRVSAERTYQALLDREPDSEDAHERMGTLYLGLGRTRDAVAQFDLALPSSRAYEDIVEAHRRLGDLPSFEQTLRDAVLASPFDSDALWALGVVYDSDHRSADAILFLRRATELTPKSCALLSMLGDAYLDAGVVDHAVDTFHRCLAIEPNNYSALIDLSSALLESGDHIAETIGLLRQAQAANPNRPEAYVNFGYIEDQAGHLQNALQFYRRALALDPLARAAYVDLAYDYLSLGLFGSSEEDLLAGLSVFPGDGRLHYMLGLTYVKQGKRDLARAEFHQALSNSEPEIVRAATVGLANT